MRYRAPVWLPGGHLQTVYPLLIKPDAPGFRRVRWETPDGDFIDIDWQTHPASTSPAPPLLVLFHGLEGNSNSHYARSLMRNVAASGWDGAVVHFRGCSGQPNRLARAYHSGDSAEIDWIVRRIKAEHRQQPLFAVGVSLGGNALLKWLGERENAALSVLDAAAAVSAPVDLTACGHQLGRGFNRVYTWHFLRTLKPSAFEKLKRFPGLFDAARLGAAKTLHAFDDVVTAPLHGFANADDYWQRAASKAWLPGIRVPTLLLNARNDPFFPECALPAAAQANSALRLDFPAAGGHVGFVDGNPPGHLDWMPRRVLRFFQHGE